MEASKAMAPVDSIPVEAKTIDANRGNGENGSCEAEKEDFKLYRMRWFVLLIFCLTSMTNSFQVRVGRDYNPV